MSHVMKLLKSKHKNGSKSTIEHKNNNEIDAPKVTKSQPIPIHSKGSSSSESTVRFSSEPHEGSKLVINSPGGSKTSCFDIKKAHSDNDFTMNISPEINKSSARNEIPEFKIKNSPTLTASSANTNKVGTSTVTGRIYTAIFDYRARTGDDLSFSKNDYLEVIEKTSADWWTAKCCQTGRQGYIPSNFVAPIKSIEAEPWYFGCMTRTESERLLTRSSNSEGSFLVRTSASKTQEHALSVRTGENVRHYRIKNNIEGGVYISSHTLFASIHKLIQHYSKKPYGLCCKLTTPCNKQDRPHTAGLSYNTMDLWEIRRDQVDLKEKLGSGNFGDVYKGVWNKTTEIAVKTLRKGRTNDEDFLAEAQVMKSLRHPKLIQLYGVCTDGEPYYIVTEFMKFGSLVKYLRVYGHANTLLEKLTVASQVASGMAYLENQKFIHRDLAARNVLVGEDLICKVADFGLSRILNESEYLAQEGARFPIRWTAPEALVYNRFSGKSDVWSYGIFLIEVFTNGAIPYAECNNHEVIEKILEGYRIPKPKDCPKEIYSLVSDCWQSEPNLRPYFKDMCDTIDRYCAILSNKAHEI